jgi:redox-sensing transcriptional repressor
MLKISNKEIPIPSLSRLLNVYRLLDQYERERVPSVSSTDIGKRLGLKPDSIRKDVSYLGEAGNYGGGYEVARLKALIGRKLHVDRKRKLCVVGLGRLGRAILNYTDLRDRGFFVVAGFDSNINKLETITSAVELHPAHEIAEVVRSKAIEIGIIAVPEISAQDIADRLVQGGIKGVVNFSPCAIKTTDNVMIRNIDLLGECALLSTLMDVGERERGKGEKGRGLLSNQKFTLL